MYLTVQEIKNKLIMLILDFEKMQIKHVKWKCIQFNSPEYYHCFESLYLENESNFIQALLDLRNLSDETYKGLDAEIMQISYYCPHRIVVHILRLSLYFNACAKDIPIELKKLFLQSFDLKSNTNFIVSYKAFGLFRSCCDFFESVANPNSLKAQLQYRKEESVPLDFTNFILLNEVTNAYSAILYEMCYRYKFINQCPCYIKDAIRAANLHDRLVGPNAWEMYLSKRSAQSIYKDISLLRKVGFKKTPCLLEELLLRIESTVLESKEKKRTFVKRMIDKNQEHIAESMKAERRTIDSFLFSKIV